MGKGHDLDEGMMRQLLDDYLAELNWAGGVDKNALVAAVKDDEALRNVIGQYVAQGTYADADAVLAVIPEQAWQDAQGDRWQGGTSTDMAGMETGFTASAANHTSVVGGTPRGAAALGERARQVASQSRDQVLSITSKAAETTKPWIDRVAKPGQTHGETSRVRDPRVAVALSAITGGLGQFYNRQPAKGAAFVVTGSALSVFSGLDTWLIRRVRPKTKARIGPNRITKRLFGLWAATFVCNLWDAWTSAKRSAITADQGRRQNRPVETWDELKPEGPVGSRTGTAAATQETDEFPTASPATP
ncbi:MAG: hypothetical protein M3R06_07410 [Chloroflexota bacterium]|nr:hypothetical protein [Chloroflexota bacterium]